MPPKAAKRGSSTPRAKRGGRGSRGTPRGKINLPEAAEEPKMVEDSMELGVNGVKPVVEEEKPVETITTAVEEERGVEMSLEDVEEENPVEKSPVRVEEETVAVQPSFRAEDESENQPEIKVEPQLEIEVQPQPVAEKNFEKVVEEEVKESIHEDEKDERLDLEDNDQEYEPEEYCVMDYDEKESEQEYHEQGDEQSGGIEEENAGGEEIDDMGDEEIEQVGEEYEGEEDGCDGGQEQIGADVEDNDHQEALKERRKRKEFEVFVGGLDKDATEEDLKKVFSKVGEVTEVRLMLNPQTKKNKGFAFLRFATAEQAKQAVTELKNPMVVYLS